VTALRRGLAAVAACVLVALCAAPAHAALDVDDGLWYYTGVGIEKQHARATGKGIHVAVIDGAINPEVPELQGTNLHVHEPSFCGDALNNPLRATDQAKAATHGTAMTSFIIGTGKGINGERGLLGLAPDADVTFYSSLTLRDSGTEGCSPTKTSSLESTFGDAIDQAVVDGADIISISMGARRTWDADAVARALHAGAIVVAARPHGAEHLEAQFPAALQGVVSVESAGPDGAPSKDAHAATVIAPGEQVRMFTDDFTGYRLANGSSFATAFTSGALALVWSAYPDATGNQILQTLIRNTDAEDHELTALDPAFGYGFVNVRHMLEHDPSDYPDTNPLLDKRPDWGPSPDEITHPTPLPTPTPTITPTPAPTPTPTTTTDPPDTGRNTDTTGTDSDMNGSTSPLPVLLATAGALLLLALITTAVLVARRGRVRNPAPATTDDE